MIKKINIFLFLLLGILFMYLADSFNDELVYADPEKEYIAYEFVVTEILNDGYVGKSTRDNTGIFFTNENLQHDQIIKKGDRVQVKMEKNNTVDGIVSIEVVH